MNNKQLDFNTEVDELSLFDIYNIVNKNKWIVFCCMIISLLLGTVYLITIKPVYESEAVLRIGYIGQTLTPGVFQNFYIENPDTLPLELSAFSKSKVFSVEVKKDSKNNSLNIINLKVQDKNPYKAKEYLTKITHDLIKRHDFMFQQVYLSRKQHLNSLEKRLSTLQTNFFSNNKGLLSEEKLKIIEIQSDLEEQIAEEELMLSDVYLQPSKILQKPTLKIKPVKPNKPVTIVVALILGIMVGIALVLIKESMNNSKSLIDIDITKNTKLQ